jgi:hypothetical protein
VKLLARALALLVLLASAPFSYAQFALPGLGGDGLRFGRDRPIIRNDQPRDVPRQNERGDRHLPDHPGGHGVDIGSGLIRGIVEEGLRRQGTEQGPGEQPKGHQPDRKTKRISKGEPQKAEPKGKPPQVNGPLLPLGQPPAVNGPLLPLGRQPPVANGPPRLEKLLPVLDLPEAKDCKDCEASRERILRVQALLAEDDSVLLELQKKKAGFEAELTGYDAKLAAASAKDQPDYDPDIAAIIARGIKEQAALTARQVADTDGQIEAMQARMADVRTRLASMLIDYMDCLKKHCPPVASVEPPPLPPYEKFDVVLPSPAKPYQQAGDVVPGREAVSSDIDCDGHTGRISVRTGDKIFGRDGGHIYAAGLNLISIGYQGTQCDDCFWTQFVWREILVTYDGAGGPSRLDMKLQTTGGTYRTTTDPEHPNYLSDSGSLIWPGYELAGLSTVTKDSDTIFDEPDYFWALHDLVDGDHDVQKVETVGHFDTFLICGGKVCAKVHWDVAQEWNRTDGNVTDNSYRNVSLSTTEKPNAAQYRAVLEKYTGGTIK